MTLFARLRGLSMSQPDVYKRQVVEVQARGAKVLALTTEAGAEALHKRCLLYTSRCV